MTAAANSNEDRFDAFVDGTLSEADRADAARRIHEDPTWAAQESLQRSIDQALRRAFAPPPPDRVLQAVERAMPDSPKAVRATPRGILQRRWAVAAILALGVVGVYRIVDFLIPETAEYPRRPWQPIQAWYDDAVASGLKPDWVCKDEKEFRTTVRRHLGQPLVLAKLPVGVSVGGLAYANVFSDRTLMVLGRAEGEPTIVFVDRIANDREQTLPADSPLHLYRRSAGDLVLYELSKLNRAVLLDYISVP